MLFIYRGNIHNTSISESLLPILCYDYTNLDYHYKGHFMKKGLFVSSLFLLLVGCQTVKPADNTKTFYIDSTLADCVGVAPMKCMKVKQDPNADWEYFYGSIQGFDYQPSYQYTLKVKQFDIANPPADAPSIRYELVEIINKTQ